MFKGVVTQILSPRDNQKIYCIKYKDSNEENITLQEWTMLVTTK